MAENKTDLHELGENVAAVMFHIMEDAEAYAAAYEKYTDKLGGWIAFQNTASRAGIIFTEESAAYTPGEDYYWIEAIEAFGNQVAESLFTGEDPTIDELHRWAIGSIKKCLIK